MMIAQASKARTVSYYGNAAVFLAIPIVFFFLPPVAPLTEVGMKVVGVFIGLLYGWVTIGLIWPSIYGILMLTFTGYAAGFNAILAASFGNSTTVLLIFMLAFSGLIEYAGVSKVISMWFITRKAVMGKPWLFGFAFLFSIYILGSLTSGTPSVLLGWSLLSGICAAVGYKPGEALPRFLFFGVLIAGPLGMDLFPFKPVTVVALTVYTSMTGLEMNYAAYIACALILDSLILAGYILFGKLVVKPDVERLRDIDEDKLDAKAVLRLDKAQKTVLGLTAFLLTALVVPSFLPKAWLVTRVFKQLGATGTIMLVMMALVLLRIDGKPVCDFNRAARQGISWDAILLTSAVLYVTGALANEATGFIPFFTGLLTPVLSGKSATVFMILLMVVATIFTNLCSNAGTASSIAPIALASAALVGANPALLIIFVIKCCHLAYFTPAASPATALCIANKEWIDQKTIVVYGAVTVAIAFVVLIVVGLPLGSLIFGRL